MQCFMISSEDLIQEFSQPYGQLMRLEVCRNQLVRYEMVHLGLK